jgi:hypothetical protein
MKIAHEEVKIHRSADRVCDRMNFGVSEGREFQRLTKGCPAFAGEFAAVGRRNIRAH